MIKISELAEKFDNDLSKSAARLGKKKVSRKQLLKDFSKNKASYQTERKKLQGLEKDIAKLEADIQGCRDSMRKSRSEMLRSNTVLQNMDLADCNYVYMYDTSDEDVGYVVDNEEYHIDVNDLGEFELIPWKKFNKERRAKTQEVKPEEPKAEEPENIEDDSAADDFPYHPNLRFID